MEVLEELRFSAADGCSLVGSLTLPERTPAPVVVAAHGSSTGTRAAPLHRHLAELLPGNGAGTFVFDRRGEGASSGQPDASLSVLAGDVAAAVAAVTWRHDVDTNTVGLWGHSQGGWIAPLAAARTPSVRFMIVVSGSGIAPADQMRFAIRNLLTEAAYGSDVVEYALSLRDRVVRHWSGLADEALPADLAAARRNPWFHLAYLPEPEELTESLVEFEFDLDLRPTLRRLHIPALLIYGETDRWFPIDQSIAVWRDAYGSPDLLTVARLPGAGHFPTLAEDPHDLDEKGPISAEYERALIQWLADRRA